MDETDRDHDLALARHHHEMAARERQLADVAGLIGAPAQAQRHLLNADLHERRAAAYEAAAHRGDGPLNPRTA